MKKSSGSTAKACLELQKYAFAPPMFNSLSPLNPPHTTQDVLNSHMKQREEFRGADERSDTVHSQNSLSVMIIVSEISHWCIKL